MISLDRDAVKFFHMIDMRKTDKLGVETYDPTTVKYKICSAFRCCFSDDEYKFESLDSSVIFSKKSLNRFLSENIGKPIDVAENSEQKVIQYVYKVAKTFSDTEKGIENPKNKPISFGIGFKNSDAIPFLPDAVDVE
jgi:hypothetical protein